MDLKQYKDVYFLHIVYLSIRFSISKMIKRKTLKVIVDSITANWIAAGFGPPKKFSVDNGELVEKFNVEIYVSLD